MKIGDIVVVVDAKALPEEFLGRYGMVKEVYPGYKVFVEFNRQVGSMGSFSHSAYETDLVVIRKGGIENED